MKLFTCRSHFKEGRVWSASQRVCDLVAVCENPSVSVLVGKHRSVQLKQNPKKRFNDICAPVVGVAAQTACGDSAGCPGVVYFLELSLGVFIHTICLAL
jgi:hypothetical protein